MRLIEVARALGMTGQQLRHELEQVDFGVRSTDREVPDQLAQGIIRFVASKYDITVKKVEEKGDATLQHEPEQRFLSLVAKEGAPPPTEGDDRSGTVALERGGGAKAKVHVLRKLSLEDVPDTVAQSFATVPPGVVQVQEQVSGQQAVRKPRTVRRLTKQELEEQMREQKLERLREKKGALNQQEQIKKKKGMVELPESISVKEFAEKSGVQVPEVISILMKNGVMVTINQHIDFDTAAVIAADLGVDVRKEQALASAERLLAGNLQEFLTEDDPLLLQPRPAIVTVMGHVDHGKTALLDAIRKTDVAKHEAGGITQSIGASLVEYDGKRITFLDTPGHAAFAAMRARGAQITDIVVLVVAADEGVKPTTIEALDHAKDAGVPVLVAINKVDAVGADPDRVRGELAQHGLQAEEWGGKTPFVRCSAKTGQGVTDVLDHLLIMAEEATLRANLDRPAVATVIESHLDSSLGPVASLIINTGTLRASDGFVCGGTHGRVKSMTGPFGERLEEVGPSGAVRIAGLSDVPVAGEILQVVGSEQEAKKLAAQMREAHARLEKRGLHDFLSRLSEGKLTTLKIVLKADSQGSLEAIEDAMRSLHAQEELEEGRFRIVPKVVHSAVGDVTEGDVMLAAASAGLVLGFTVDVPLHVEKVASQHGVQIRRHEVIYELLTEVEALLQGLVEPEEKEKILGHLEVRGTFFQKHSEQVVGGKVTDGVIKRVPFRVLRPAARGGSGAASQEEVGAGRITSLRSVDRDIKEAKEGSECGLRIECPVTITVGDTLEVFVKEFKKKDSSGK